MYACGRDIFRTITKIVEQVKQLFFSIGDCKMHSSSGHFNGNFKQAISNSTDEN